MTITKEETAIILDRFGAAFGGEMSAEKVDVWLKQIHHLDPEIAMRAVDEYIGSEMIAPKVAPFLEVYRDLAKRADAERRRREQGTPVADCECRGSGWLEVDGYVRNGHRYDNVVRPCEFCAPKSYEQWATQWKPDLAARRRQRRPAELLPASPTEGISAARDVLKHIDTVDEIQPF